MTKVDDTEPDWAALKKIGNEVYELRLAGKFDKEAFDRLYPLAVEAVKDAKANGHLLEFIANAAQDDWFPE